MRYVKATLVVAALASCQRVSEPEAQAPPEAVAESSPKAAAAPERGLAAGAAPKAASPQLAEAPPPAARRPGAVRIVRVFSKKTDYRDLVSAACLEDERLMGGGCDVQGGYENVRKSYPSAPKSEDTYGGKWNCGYQGKYSGIGVEAYALCQYAPRAAAAKKARSKPKARKRR